MNMKTIKIENQEINYAARTLVYKNIRVVICERVNVAYLCMKKEGRNGSPEHSTLYKLINHRANKISKIFCSSCTTFQRTHYYKNYCTRTPGIPIVFLFHFIFLSIRSFVRFSTFRCAFVGCLFLFRSAFHIESGRNGVLNARKARLRVYVRDALWVVVVCARPSN